MHHWHRRGHDDLGFQGNPEATMGVNIMIGATECYTSVVHLQTAVAILASARKEKDNFVPSERFSIPGSTVKAPGGHHGCWYPDRSYMSIKSHMSPLLEQGKWLFCWTRTFAQILDGCCFWSRPVPGESIFTHMDAYEEFTSDEIY